MFSLATRLDCEKLKTTGRGYLGVPLRGADVEVDVVRGLENSNVVLDSLKLCMDTSLRIVTKEAGAQQVTTEGDNNRRQEEKKKSALGKNEAGLSSTTKRQIFSLFHNHNQKETLYEIEPTNGLAGSAHWSLKEVQEARCRYPPVNPTRTCDKVSERQF